MVCRSEQKSWPIAVTLTVVYINKVAYHKHIIGDNSGFRSIRQYIYINRNGLVTHSHM